MAQLPDEPIPLMPAAGTPWQTGNVTLVMNRGTKEVQQAQDETLSPQASRETVPFSTGMAIGAAPDDEEPTIEQYMAELLARTQPMAVKADLAKTRAAARGRGPGKPAPAEAPAGGTASVTPSVAVPETRHTFSELRELANINARSTFNVYRIQRIILDMHGHRFVTLTAVLATFVLLTLAHDARSPAYVAAVATGITAGVWSLKYLAGARELATFWHREAGDSED